MSRAVVVDPPIHFGARRSGILSPEPLDEHDLYPIHEEDDVPDNPFCELLARYFRYALAAYFPNRWVTGDICMYWDEDDTEHYAAPDVLVVDGPTPDPLPSTYLRWREPSPLLVVEFGSRSTFRRDEGPKLSTYGRDLRVPEYLYYHPQRRDLRLHRLGEGEYDLVSPDARGWMHCETLNLWFGRDGVGRLWVYTPSGERLLTHEEEVRARQAEARARRVAEARAVEAEARLAEMEAELHRLRTRHSDHSRP